ncbi:MAG: AraC family transcriptional regulator [Nibricoccus sp.]
MDKTAQSMDGLNMPSKIKAVRWRTAQTLHQIQILSCDLCDFVTWESPDHCAPFWRLYWHNKRGGEIAVAGKSIPLRPGCLLLIPPNTHFSSRLRNPVRQLFVHFLVEPRFRGKGNAVFQIPLTKELASHCKQIAGQLTSDTLSLRTSLLSQILVSKALLELPLNEWAPRFEDPRITNAVEAIAKEYPARLDNVTLARKARMHPSAFIRLFRQCTGHTPLDYLTNLRLEEACSMLHYDEASLDEIADKTGFGERGYFTRIFSRNMNCSPARYRKLVNVSNRLRPGG